MLARGCRDRRAPWRTPVLSTVCRQGAPRARVLVLRRAEPGTGLLWLHTDARSAKVAELRAEPRAALTFWDPRRALQLRVEGQARIESDAAVLAEAWARVPEGSRWTYAAGAAPGTPAGEEELPGGDGQANFAMIALEARRLEWLWLGPAAHLRGESVRAGAGWAARALVP